MSHQADHCEVAIIGGGLSGLTAAKVLDDAGRDFRILEAASRLGGRIDALRDDATHQPLGDLGPTWVWPPYQATVREWIERLELRTFPQYESGDAVLELEANAPPARQFLPGQHGMARIVGGPSAFVEALSRQTEEARVHLDCAVTKIERSGKLFQIHCRGGETFKANRVIVAAPLRVMAEQVEWSGLLDEQVHSIMRGAPTWMATQAKVTVLYDRPFWREAGLSGRVASRLGPMVEMHDHCGEDGQPAALFGFVGWPPNLRQQRDLRSDLVDQLVRCFGEQAAAYRQLEIRDWTIRATICARRDLETAPSHPLRLDSTMRQGHCDGGLFFAVAETASDSPGLIDGALKAGHRAARQCLQNEPSTTPE